MLQIKEQYLDKIGVELDSFEKLCSSIEHQSFLLDKLKRFLIKKDIEKLRISTSLYFDNILNYETTHPQYLSLLENLKKIRIIIQTRLSKRFNPRIIINNRILRPKKDEYCYACCKFFDIPHIINECIYFTKERKYYFTDRKPEILSSLENVNSNKINEIIGFLKLAVEKYEKLFC